MDDVLAMDNSLSSEALSEVKESKEQGLDQRKHLSLSKTSLHSNSMDEYVFCDNIVFNNMPIYTYLCLYFMLLVMEYFAVSSHFSFFFHYV